MIIVKIKGGLGNQLFQWACGKHLSEKYNIPFYLDISFFDNSNRNFGLNKFPFITYELITSHPEIKIIKFSKKLDNFNFNDNLYNGNDIFIDGYWQSEKYFIDIKDIIIENLQPNELTLSKLRNSYNLNDSVSIHIRRTDYVGSFRHPTQTIEYYMKALSLIKSKNILVFSDDMDWCKNNLKISNITFVENNDNINDLWLMSLCDNNIIANSSFSWWGAWLNKNVHKKIIAPSEWFSKSSNLNYSDIVPSNWIKL